MKDAAEKWCKNATNYTAKHGGKRSHYRLIPRTIPSQKDLHRSPQERMIQHHHEYEKAEAK